MPQDHLSKQYDLDLEAIRSRVLLMGGLVEVQFQDAIQSLFDRDVVKAEKVLNSDVEVNRLEVSLDSACTNLIVRRQPAANDLRTVMATTKVITDLERVGDEATKIARSTKNLQSREYQLVEQYDKIKMIAETAGSMLHDALDAFARLDRELAIKLIGRDALIDYEFHAMMRNLIPYMKEDPPTIPASLDIMWIAKSIERVGDHSTNIAEQVIYVVDGKDIRHSDYSSVNTEQTV
ncbi:MAG: phosphate signaling complex protein PhoU [Burkholderiaceae bacterium]|nr:phosphate signaling complex protein PhoU [Burkholderiaceae bacterium]